MTKNLISNHDSPLCFFSHLIQIQTCSVPWHPHILSRPMTAPNFEVGSLSRVYAGHTKNVTRYTTWDLGSNPMQCNATPSVLYASLHLVRDNKTQAKHYCTGGNGKCGHVLCMKSIVTLFTPHLHAQKAKAVPGPGTRTTTCMAAR